MFALIFQKPFVVFLQNGKTIKQNERIFNLLETFNLTERIYDSKTSVQNILEIPINWENVSTIMHNQRKIATEFLKNVGL